MQQNPFDYLRTDMKEETVESDAPEDISVDDGVERMAGEGGVATEIPHELTQTDSLSAKTGKDELEQ